MFEYLKGVLAHASPGKAVVESGGVGYKILIGLSTYARLPKIGSESLFFLSFIVREDAQLLYGFLAEEERDFFEKLISVSGIGPKTSLAVLGHMEMDVLYSAIASQNVSLLSKVPGVGKKTAERVIIELRDKLQKKVVVTTGASGFFGLSADAVSALVNLGYHPGEAEKAVKKVLESSGSEVDLPRLISLSLRAI